MKDGYRVIDADGHIIEPSGLWRDYKVNTWAVREPEATDDRALRKSRIQRQCYVSADA
jgi:hypothetical protein